MKFVKGKKFKYKQLEELLHSSAQSPLSVIKEKLNSCRLKLKMKGKDQKEIARVTKTK